MKKSCALLLACALFLCACARVSPADKGAASQTLIVGNSADPSSLDPTLVSGLPEFKILRALFEGLVTADSKTLEPLPAAASSWEKSGKTYTFKIRENANWSDGEPLKSTDFAFAFKRMLNPLLAAEYAGFLTPIKNAEKIRSGLLGADSLGVKTPDLKTLVIELEYDCPHFLNLLCYSPFFPLPEHALKKFNAQSRRDAVWMRPENAVSNGPFVLKEYKINEKIRVEKNPSYWDSRNVKLRAVEFLPISNIYTEDRAFRAGQLHITDSVAPARLGNPAGIPPRSLRISDFLGVYYYTFNMKRPPLDNPKVREALAIAIPRGAIIENFLKGGQRPAYSFVPESVSKTYKSSAKIPRDLSLARKLLAEAGYPNGKGFPKIRITYNTSEQHKPIAEAVQAAWKKELGIKCELYNLSWPAYNAARKSGDFDITRSSWIADYLSPETFLSIFLSKSRQNYCGFKSESFDRLMDEAKSSPEAEKLYIEAEALVVKACAVAPIYFYTRARLVDPRVKNWNENPLDYPDYKPVYLSEKGGEN